MSAPLIVTLQLNKEAFQFFNTLRKQYFPAERNYLDAHLTLFHHLPAAEPVIENTIQNIAAEQTILTLSVTDIVHIGNGVAYRIQSKALTELHQFFQQQWQPWLIPQDKQKLWPHITIQNKVSAPAANEVQQKLSATFVPFDMYGKGLCLWEYHNGPWKYMTTYLFKK